MPIQIFPRIPGFGEQLATGLSRGLGTGMEALTKLKMKQLVDQQQMAPLVAMVKQMYGPPEAAIPPTGAAAPPEIPVEPEVTPPEVTPPEVTPPGVAPVAKRIVSAEDYTSLQLAAMSKRPEVLGKTISDIGKREYQERALIQKRELAQRAETRKYREETLKEEKTLKQEEMALRKLKKLSTTKDLDHPAYVKGVKQFGLEYLLSPESTEYEKTTADLLRRIVVGTKGRVSEMVVREFIKSFPSLTINPEGRKRIEDTLLISNKISQFYPQTMREIIKEHKGLPPFDLNEMVNERVDKKIEPYVDDLIQTVTGKPTVTGKLAGLPPPELYKEGDQLKNKETGQIEYEHTGFGWREL